MNAKTPPSMAIPRYDCPADWSQPHYRLALHWAPEEGGPDHGDSRGSGAIRPQSILLHLPEDHSKIAPTHTLNPFNGCIGAISMAAPAHTEPLIEPLNSSRGASRTGGIENKGAIKNYAWQGQIIRLSQAQLDKWRASYPYIPDLEAVLQKADDYYAENPPPEGKWFFRVSRWLEEENAKHAERRKAAERQSDSW